MITFLESIRRISPKIIFTTEPLPSAITYHLIIHSTHFDILSGFFFSKWGDFHFSLVLLEIQCSRRSKVPPADKFAPHAMMKTAAINLKICLPRTRNSNYSLSFPSPFSMCEYMRLITRDELPFYIAGERKVKTQMRNSVSKMREKLTG